MSSRQDILRWVMSNHTELLRQKDCVAATGATRQYVSKLFNSMVEAGGIERAEPPWYKVVSIENLLETYHEVEKPIYIEPTRIFRSAELYLELVNCIDAFASVANETYPDMQEHMLTLRQDLKNEISDSIKSLAKLQSYINNVTPRRKRKLAERAARDSHFSERCYKALATFAEDWRRKQLIASMPEDEEDWDKYVRSEL